MTRGAVRGARFSLSGSQAMAAVKLVGGRPLM